MKKTWIVVFAILCVLCLVSCQSSQEDVGEAAVFPSDSSTSEEVAMVDDDAVGDDTQASGPTTDDTDPSGNGESEALNPEAVDECVKCHTDKQMLIDTAKPLEVIESENEGEG